MPSGGGCECGAVRFEAAVADWTATACHCGQCRRWSGHFWVSIEVPEADLTLVKDETLRWRRSSENAERGFCSACGSSLFWRRRGGPRVSIAAGALDDANPVVLAADIYTKGRPRYYPLHASVPAFEEDRHDEPTPD